MKFDSGTKIWWEKEKILVTNIFSISHNVLKKVTITQKNEIWFRDENMVGKGENISYQHFSISHNVFYKVTMTPKIEIWFREESMVGKGENIGYHYFLHCPQCFRKCFLSGWFDQVVSQGCVINSFPNKPWFLHVCSTSLLKTLWEKEKLLITSNFSFSHSVFYLLGKLSANFIKFEIVVCKLLEFGRV